MKKLIIITVLLALLLCACARQGETQNNTGEPESTAVQNSTSQSTAAERESTQKTEATNMKMQIGKQAFSIRLEQNESAAALAAHLPLTLLMSELHGNEKYYYLPFSLPTNEVAVGQIHTGDVMLFGDNCLVIFYKDFSTSYAYTKIGTVTNTAGLADALGTGEAECEFKF